MKIKLTKEALNGYSWCDENAEPIDVTGSVLEASTTDDGLVVVLGEQLLLTGATSFSAELKYPFFPDEFEVLEEC